MLGKQREVLKNREDQITRLQQDLAAAEERAAGPSPQMTELTAALAERDKELKARGETMRAVEDDLAAMQASVRHATAALAAAEEQAASERSAHESTKQQIAERDTMVRELETQQASLIDSKLKLQQNFDAYKKRAAAALKRADVEPNGPPSGTTPPPAPVSQASAEDTRDRGGAGGSTAGAADAGAGSGAGQDDGQTTRAELEAYKARTAAALRKANESAAAVRESLLAQQRTAVQQAAQEARRPLKQQLVNLQHQHDDLRRQALVDRQTAEAAQSESKGMQRALERMTSDVAAACQRASAAESALRRARLDLAQRDPDPNPAPAPHSSKTYDAQTLDALKDKVRSLEGALAAATAAAAAAAPPNGAAANTMTALGETSALVESSNGHEAHDMLPDTAGGGPHDQRAEDPGPARPPPLDLLRSDSDSAATAATPTSPAAAVSPAVGAGGISGAEALGRSTHDRRLIVALQSELAETTLSLGEAQEEAAALRLVNDNLLKTVERERELCSADPDQRIRNAEYLKNVVYKWIVSVDRTERQRLLPAMVQMLHLSSEEQQAIVEHLDRGPLRRVAGGVTNLLWGGT